ncbi:hypothetical protein [Adhaeribacter aquaticus]|uniref:hypothetical protein n=1 Tax=Adhaeribacter aquaticus TaxID=299567 RepID=UPI0003F7D61C|nr:hypothetical protein [Adhaeribacter aquaticus]
MTIFKTNEGEVVYRTLCRMSSAGRAIRKAAKKGKTSLVAIEPDGQQFNYSFMLNRYYEEHQLSPVA